MLEHQVASCLASVLSPLLSNRFSDFIWGSNVPRGKTTFLNLPCYLAKCWQKLLGKTPRKLLWTGLTQLGSMFFLPGSWTYRWSSGSYFVLWSDFAKKMEGTKKRGAIDRRSLGPRWYCRSTVLIHLGKRASYYLQLSTIPNLFGANKGEKEAWV